MKREIPANIAIIMDGNGRWAKAKGLPRTKGHLQGSENIRIIAKEANKLGIKNLILYAFSTENWARPEEEKKYLFQLPQLFFGKYIDELKRENIRVSAIGEYEKFPASTVSVINKAIEETKNCTGCNLCLAVNYGGRREIMLAAKQMAEDYKKGIVEEINEDCLSDYLMTEVKDVDLLIRTSGEVRVSNFLLWQIAYAEMMFVDCAWPDFSVEELHKCLEAYQYRDRRFGGLKNEN